MMETFLEDHFYKALEWVMKQNEFVVETSLVGVVMNGLSHMHGVKVKQEFACRLIRGLGANLAPSVKTAFAKEVFSFFSVFCRFFNSLLNGQILSDLSGCHIFICCWKEHQPTLVSARST